MFPTDSSSASSPFSARSTMASSPETDPPPKGETPQTTFAGALEEMKRLQMVSGVNGHMQGGPKYDGRGLPPRSSTSPSAQQSLASLHMTYSQPASSSSARLDAALAGYHGGARTEPPRRIAGVDALPVNNPAPKDLVRNVNANRLLLQGDPQYVTKQRVETAIRVILDLLRLIPTSPTPPPVPDQLAHLLVRSPDGKIISSLERVGTFKALRLQAGTTTKLLSKKQAQAGPSPKEQSLFVETAVYTSGEHPRRVYACKRCRMRELKRRQSKDANRKKQPHNSNSESDSSLPKRSTKTPSDREPSQDYITGENAEQYDPLRKSQTIEEPPWDAGAQDWRHEMVLFNSPPEVSVKDGSCMWLPFRVICYGKCHGEKNGFTVKFNLRLHSGEIVFSASTLPIRITDDHKTDTKVKTHRADSKDLKIAPTSATRARKGRASAASSRRQSPAPSDTESIQSVSEAGAVTSKQTPQVRGKPYDRPSFHGIHTVTSVPEPHRSPSSGSLHPVPSMSPLPKQGDVSTNPFGQLGPRGTVSPAGIAGQAFDFSAFDGSIFDPNGTNFPASASHSATSSNLASPMTGPVTLNRDEIMLASNMPSSPNDLLSTLNLSSLQGLEQQQRQQEVLPQPSYTGGMGLMNMSQPMNTSLDHIFDTSSLTSFTSDFNDGTSAFSGNVGDGSLYSDSGVVPDDMQEFVDFTGGQGMQVDQSSNTSPTTFFPNGGLQNLQSSYPSISPRQRQFNNVSPTSSLPAISPVPSHQPVILPQQPPPNMPRMSTIIPSDGPVAGGTTVAIIGMNFAPGSVVLFGDRIAKVQVVQSGFIQCQAPPAPGPGTVEVAIAGVPMLQGVEQQFYRYNMMDTDLMMLALQVKDQYAGSSNDAAYRLAQHVASRSQNQDWPGASGPWTSQTTRSPHESRENLADSEGSSFIKPLEGAVQDLQITVVNYLASLDQDAPGSLRRSGAVNHRNPAKQTLLHIATVMGYSRLVRRLIVIGAQLDLQDVNGYTALGLASLMGRLGCARVLIEAGASYDRPTAFGEMPLDLAKIGDHAGVEALLLSAVWSTAPGPANTETDPVPSLESGSQVDDDNLSSGESDVKETSRVLLSRRSSKRLRGKQRQLSLHRRRRSTSPAPISRRSSLSSTPQPTPVLPPTTPPEAPPPYEGHAAHGSPGKIPRAASSGEIPTSTIANKAVSNDSNMFKLPFAEAVWDRLPVPLSSFLDKYAIHPGSSTDGNDSRSSATGWVAFPAPSWETLQRMTSPEEVKIFTQAMAAAAFNAVMQGGGMAGAATNGESSGSRSRSNSRRDLVEIDGDSGSPRGSVASVNGGAVKKRRPAKGREGSGSSGVPGSPTTKVIKHVKRDRMLYLFWLPVLLFVGFWLAVTALPLATGFCLIYARQITRAIKQRM